MVNTRSESHEPVRCFAATQPSVTSVTNPPESRISRSFLDFGAALLFFRPVVVASVSVVRAIIAIVEDDVPYYEWNVARRLRELHHGTAPTCRGVSSSM